MMGGSSRARSGPDFESETSGSCLRLSSSESAFSTRVARRRRGLGARTAGGVGDGGSASTSPEAARASARGASSSAFARTSSVSGVGGGAFPAPVSTSSGAATSGLPATSAAGTGGASNGGAYGSSSRFEGDAPCVSSAEAAPSSRRGRTLLVGCLRGAVAVTRAGACSTVGGAAATGRRVSARERRRRRPADAEEGAAGVGVTGASGTIARTSAGRQRTSTAGLAGRLGLTGTLTGTGRCCGLGWASS